MVNATRPRAAEIGAAAGAGWGVLAQFWMRLVAPDPEFSWTGTLGVGAAAVLLLAACSEGDTSAGPTAPSMNASQTIQTPIDASAHPIVFVSRRAGSLDLWLMKPNGSDPLQLTAGPFDEGEPAWSPDGRRVAFAMNQGVDSPPDIYVIESDGTGQRQLTDTDRCEARPSWSPDGKKLVYTAGDDCAGKSPIFVMNSDGSDQRLLIDENAVWPDWSPDGRNILYTPVLHGQSHGITVRDADGSHPIELDTGDLPQVEEATWSPDSSQIAFVASTGPLTSPSTMDSNIFVMNVDGTHLREVVSTRGNDHYPPAWSPDGNSLIYSASGPVTMTDEKTYELMSVDLDTLQTAQLTDNKALDLLPAWRE
jgi:TolB protein